MNFRRSSQEPGGWRSCSPEFGVFACRGASQAVATLGLIVLLLPFSAIAHEARLVNANVQTRTAASGFEREVRSVSSHLLLIFRGAPQTCFAPPGGV